MAAPVKFYFDLITSPSRALLTFFKMANIPIEEKRISLGEHLSKDKSRLQQIPVIHDEDFELSESVAILRYIVAKYPVDDVWYPKDPKERARVDEYLSWAVHNMHTLASNLNAPEMTFLSRFRDPKLNEAQGDSEVIKNLQKALDELEELWTWTEYIAGNKLTIADVFAACDIEQTRMTGVDPMAGRPKLAAWFERTRFQLDPYFTEHHQCIYDAEKAMKNKA